MQEDITFASFDEFRGKKLEIRISHQRYAYSSDGTGPTETKLKSLFHEGNRRH